MEDNPQKTRRISLKNKEGKPSNTRRVNPPQHKEGRHEKEKG
jgi:hypothetical protein